MLRNFQPHFPKILRNPSLSQKVTFLQKILSVVSVSSLDCFHIPRYRSNLGLVYYTTLVSVTVRPIVSCSKGLPKRVVDQPIKENRTLYLIVTSGDMGLYINDDTLTPSPLLYKACQFIVKLARKG